MFESRVPGSASRLGRRDSRNVPAQITAVGSLGFERKKCRQTRGGKGRRGRRGERCQARGKEPVGGQRWPAIRSGSWQEETAEPKPKQGIVKGEARAPKFERVRLLERRDDKEWHSRATTTTSATWNINWGKRDVVDRGWAPPKPEPARPAPLRDSSQGVTPPADYRSMFPGQFRERLQMEPARRLDHRNATRQDHRFAGGMDKYRAMAVAGSWALLHPLEPTISSSKEQYLL
ncbi:hypothetical protein B0T21DRAFT_344382 [Apiosordaria backusii]|uniref:Uncharacterized protein n=1 Tax=Apiosordaria backusii TaxID=314023 RepID=A0AA40F041_9PEZI|nr:hypothetical protein B0T21DRAFT_344382 [Apiosordaria backusii]